MCVFEFDSFIICERGLQVFGWERKHLRARAFAPASPSLFRKRTCGNLSARRQSSQPCLQASCKSTCHIRR